MGSLNISWEFLWKLFFIVLLGWMLFLARDIVAALLLSIVISTAFDPAVSYLERKRVPRILGTLIIYLIATIAIALVLYAIVPIALTELANLIDYSGGVLGKTFDAGNVEEFVGALNEALEKFRFLVSGEITIFDLTSRFLGGLISAVTIFALSFYLTVGRDGVEKFLLAILPAAYEERALRLYTRVGRKIGRWLTGQLFISLVVGLATFLGLWLLGVRYSFFLGLLAAVAEIIPYVGPIFTGSVALIVGFSDSFSLGIYAFLLFAVIQQLEGHVLLPYVMRYTTALNPAVILTSLLIGGKVFGVVGLVLAVPIAVFCQELLEEWAEEKQSRRGLRI